MAKVLISMPDELLASMDAAAQSQSLTRSELVRAAIRRYLVEEPMARRHQAIEELRAILGKGRWNAEELVRAERER